MLDAIVVSNGWDDATVALQLLSHLEGDVLIPERGSVGSGQPAGVANGTGGCADSTLRLAGAASGFSATI